MMLVNFLRATFPVVVSIALIFSILLSGVNRVDAAVPGFNPPGNYRKDNSPELVIDPSDLQEVIEDPKEEIGMDDIFGSKQIFPFEMGLGNSAF